MQACANHRCDGVDSVHASLYSRLTCTLQYLSNTFLAQKFSAVPSKWLIECGAIASSLRGDRTSCRNGAAHQNTSSASKAPTILGAISEAKVRRFSGGGPPREGPMITTVSPDTTSLTVPCSHPVAIAPNTPRTRLRSIHKINTQLNTHN